MARLKVLFLGVISLILVAGCGYHLRGAVELGEGFKDVYIQGADNDFAMRNAIAKLLRQNGASVVEDATVATGVLLIRSIKETRDAVSFNADGDAARYRLTLRVSFATQIGTQGKTGADQLSQAQISHAYDSAQPLLMEREEQRLFRQLRDKVAQNILRLMAKRTRVK